MTVAYFCVLIASLLPIVWVAYAKLSLGFKIKHNNAPRDLLAGAEGKALRARWAQENSWEAFAPFAAAVIIASIVGVSQSLIDQLAITFIVMRLLYGIFYICDMASMRSLVWFVAISCNFALYYFSWAQS